VAWGKRHRTGALYETGELHTTLNHTGHKGTDITQCSKYMGIGALHSDAIQEAHRGCTQKVATTKAQQGHNQAHVITGGIAKHMLFEANMFFCK
jgi:hypothetical protein